MLYKCFVFAGKVDLPFLRGHAVVENSRKDGSLFSEPVINWSMLRRFDNSYYKLAGGRVDDITSWKMSSEGGRRAIKYADLSCWRRRVSRAVIYSSLARWCRVVITKSLDTGSILIPAADALARMWPIPNSYKD